MTQYRVLVRLANGAQTWTLVEAADIGRARALAESQYGSGSVLQVINVR